MIITTTTPADEKEIAALTNAILGVCDNHKAGNAVMALIFAMTDVLIESGYELIESDSVVDALRFAIKDARTEKDN